MASEKPTGGSVVRLLRESPNRTLPIKKLRMEVARSFGSNDPESVKPVLKDILNHLMEKRRVEMVGKNVILLKKDKDYKSSSGEGGAVKSKRKREEEDPRTENKTSSEASDVKPISTHERYQTDHDGGGKRVFLGNLSFKIDAPKLKSVIPGITHIKWITDKERHQFYGSAFIELATARDAEAAVSMAGTNLLGRPLKANFAPPRPGDSWPPLDDGSRGPHASNNEDGAGESKSAKQAREPGPKPFFDCKTLFLGNLSYSIDEAALGEFFNECGAYKNVRWLTHADSGDFKGVGYVEFWDSDTADKAVLLNGKGLLGRPIRIDWDAGGRR
mmetsp:Transcript_44628/g.100773  ORF Transcript_44628/g.100773 Transcript_44628/m.100773 type:complete len:330 (-) Transcript_44628:202-1191(-)